MQGLFFDMKFLVVGCGSIGQRHIQNLRNLSVGEIIVYRVKKRKLNEIEEKYRVRTYNDLDEALDQNPTAVLVTNPTSLHMPIALAAARRGCHLFIEKPISHSLDSTAELIDVARKNNLVILVGYNMRFHPSLILIKDLLNKNSIGNVISARVQAGQYLPDWHPYEDYREGYSAKKSLGGGVILDMSHELDYIRWFLGEVKEVFSFSYKLSHLDIDTEGVAEILLRFRSGAIAEVHLDYVQRSSSRSCQIIGEDGTILWDSNEKQVKLFSAKDKKWQVFPESIDYNQMYIEEMKHFINCIEGKEEPLINETDGKKVLEIALAAKESSKTGKVVKL